VLTFTAFFNYAIIAINNTQDNSLLGLSVVLFSVVLQLMNLGIIAVYAYSFCFFSKYYSQQQTSSQEQEKQVKMNVRHIRIFFLMMIVVIILR